VKTTTFGAFLSLLRQGRPAARYARSASCTAAGGSRTSRTSSTWATRSRWRIREIDDRGKLSLVPVEVIEREAAGEDLGGGESEDRPGSGPTGAATVATVRSAARAVATVTVVPSALRGGHRE